MASIDVTTFKHNKKEFVKAEIEFSLPMDKELHDSFIKWVQECYTKKDNPVELKETEK